MSRPLLSTCSGLARVLATISLCCGLCPGQEHDSQTKTRAQTRTEQPTEPMGSLLPWPVVKEKIEALSQIPVKGCTPGDLTLNRLARLANQHLEKAGRSERVFLEAEGDWDVEAALKGNFFSPLFRSTEPLDRKHLADQINAGSLGDLVMNLPVLFHISMRWFEKGYACTGSAPSVDPVLEHRHRPKTYKIRVSAPRPDKATPPP